MDNMIINIHKYINTICYNHIQTFIRYIEA